MLSNFFRLVCFGLCMGTADIIPGISGGTIAFIMGFYEDLLNSIKSFDRTALFLLFKGQISKFFQTVAWKFLAGLLTGIVIAMISLAHLVTYILNHETYRPLLYAAFFGLIIASAILCMRELKKWTFKHLLLFFTTASIAFFLTGSSIPLSSSESLFDVHVPYQTHISLRNYNSSTQMLTNVPVSTLSAMVAKKIISPSTAVYSHQDQSSGEAKDFIVHTSPSYLNGWIITCGAIAICAMILPGISGSYLLSILGMYPIVIGALADFTSHLRQGLFDIDAFFILFNMLIGILLGALFFTRIVSYLLNRYHDLTIASLTGFMIGALKSVWPFWTYEYSLLPLNIAKGPQLETIDPILPFFSEIWLSLGLAIAGAMLVFGLHVVMNRTRTNRTNTTHTTNRTRTTS